MKCSESCWMLRVKPGSWPVDVNMFTIRPCCDIYCLYQALTTFNRGYVNVFCIMLIIKIRRTGKRNTMARASHKCEMRSWWWEWGHSGSPVLMIRLSLRHWHGSGVNLRSVKSKWADYGWPVTRSHGLIPHNKMTPLITNSKGSRRDFLQVLNLILCMVLIK